MNYTYLKNRGFTLVEMVVIAPFVILAIGAFIGAIVNLTGEVIASQGSNTLAYNVQDALDRIEDDVNSSANFLSTNSITFAAGNPQGYGAVGSTTNFTNVGGTSGTSLILSSVVTNGNPLNISTSPVYLINQPHACTNAAEYSLNQPMMMNIIYFTDSSDTLWRRTVMPTNYTDGAARCGPAPWQLPSCQLNYVSSFCKTNDVKLVEGVRNSNFSIQYYATAGSTTPDSVAVDQSASTTTRNNALQLTNTVEVTIQAEAVLAGRDVDRSGTIRATRF